MIKLGLLLYPDCLTAGHFSMLDAFQVANQVKGKDIFQAQIVSRDGKPVRCAHGQKVYARFSVLEWKPDVLVIPGFWTTSAENALQFLETQPDIIDLISTVPKETKIWSYCAGVLLHARTGRLDQLEATATWWIARGLEASFPKVHWQINQLIAKQKRDVTASGANGFYPLIEHAMEVYANEHVLHDVRKYLMTPQQFQRNDPFFQVDGTTSLNVKILKMRKIIEKTPAHIVSVKMIAETLGVSEKTLGRFLKKYTDWKPATLIRMIKFKQAAELLTRNHMSVSEVCDKLGFIDESNFRRSFKSAAKMTPGEYQEKFRF